MKKHITNDDDILGIINNMPIIKLPILKMICVHAEEKAVSNKDLEYSVAVLSMLYGYALGKHEERMRKNKGLSIPQK